MFSVKRVTNLLKKLQNEYVIGEGVDVKLSPVASKGIIYGSAKMHTPFNPVHFRKLY